MGAPHCLPRYGGFNSRTPGGVRRTERDFTIRSGAFQFTHPGRGATKTYKDTAKFSQVSIHAPREGCDEDVLLRK